MEQTFALVSNKETMAIQQLGEMEAALDGITDPEELVRAKNNIAPVMTYLKQINVARGVMVKAATLKLKIERRLGKWLIENTRASSPTGTNIRGSLRLGKPGSASPAETTKTYGIRPEQQQAMLRIASISDKDLDYYFKAEKNSGRLPSTSRLASYAKRVLEGGGRTRSIGIGRKRVIPEGAMKVTDTTRGQTTIEIDGVSNLKIYVALTGNYSTKDTIVKGAVADSICSLYNTYHKKNDRQMGRDIQ